MSLKNYSNLTGEQLQELLENSDTSKEIRIWVEMENDDGSIYLQGRRLVGTIDDPNDKYLCLIAGLYREESD